MIEINLPDYSPPDKCKRPAEKVDFSELNQDSFAEAASFVIDAELSGALSGLSEERIIAWLKAITENFETRHTVSPLNVEAAKWLRSEFQSIGYSDIEFHDFEYQGLTRHNVVITKPGMTETDSFILVCAHYDSRMENLHNHTSAAPGANDNASGIITLLELSRILHPLETDRSIRFVCFSGEEQGLFGSKAYAKHAHDNRIKIHLLVNLDMVGHPDISSDPTIIIEVDTGNESAANDAPSRQFAKEMASAAAACTSIKTRFGQIYSSDYMPFEHFGYVCVGVYDGADGEAFYHTTNDTSEKVDTAVCLEIVKMLTAFVRQAAKK